MDGNMRKRYRRNLEPMLDMTFREILGSIECCGKSRRRLRAMLGSMRDCSSTNCSWVAYRFTECFEWMVVRQLPAEEESDGRSGKD